MKKFVIYPISSESQSIIAFLNACGKEKTIQIDNEFILVQVLESYIFFGQGSPIHQMQQNLEIADAIFMLYNSEDPETFRFKNVFAEIDNSKFRKAAAPFFFITMNQNFIIPDSLEKYRDDITKQFGVRCVSISLNSPETIDRIIVEAIQENRLKRSRSKVNLLLQKFQPIPE